MLHRHNADAHLRIYSPDAIAIHSILKQICTEVEHLNAQLERLNDDIQEQQAQDVEAMQWYEELSHFKQTIHIAQDRLHDFMRDSELAHTPMQSATAMHSKNTASAAVTGLFTPSTSLDAAVQPACTCGVCAHRLQDLASRLLPVPHDEV